MEKEPPALGIPLDRAENRAMHRRMLALLLLAGWIATFALAAASPAADRLPPPTVAQLVLRLGSSDFADREEASRALDGLGTPALAELRKAALSNDPEVRRRSRELVQRIEKRSETARLLEPHRVHLIFKDTPVAEALADFARQSGCNLELGGDRTRLAQRKVTLDTGVVTFWEAFDQFCRQAGLVEASLAPENDPGRQGNPDDNNFALPPQFRMQQMMWSSNYRNGTPFGDTSRLVVVDGTQPLLPTGLAGALRVRALPAKTPLPVVFSGDGEKVVPLEITPEPGLAWQGLLSVRVTSAVDDRGQSLTQPVVYVGNGDAANNPDMMWMMWGSPYGNYDVPLNPLHVPLQLRTGRLPARIVTELRGSLSAQILTPLEPLLTVEDVTRATGRSEQAANGAALKVLEVKQAPSGEVRLRVQLQVPAPETDAGPVGVGRQWRINRAVWMMGGRQEVGEVPNLELQDARGQTFTRVNPEATRVAANSIPQELELTFQPHAGQAAPTRLVYLARRSVLVEVPFTLKDVALP
jgi:hypothetical protein